MKRSGIRTETNSGMNRIRRLILLLLLSLTSASLLAQDSEDSPAVSTFDWTNSTLRLTVSTRLEPQGRNGAAASWEAQRRLDDLYQYQLLERLYRVPVDSQRTIGQYIEEDPSIATELLRRAANADRGVPYASRDLSHLLRDYTVRVFPDLAEIFVRHESPFRMEEVVRWLPTRRYTGVVIYAGEPLPIRGELTRDGDPQYADIEPALFPEIFDSDFRPVLQQDMLHTDWIRRWGIVAYTESFDETQWIDRIGNNPLRIMAEQIFGVRPSDIIVSVNDADRLLASSHNREILRQGRIVVIVPAGVSSD